ncbi:2-oxo-4-hydroxy-4-carboxy-5-ureidoimidazoline decarboxylase [Microtetraspora sp. NBRC 16547]|uniref:2-oxo-4-hydroxy-4-carboxy-5-ureidoimidazoline decarboxylase n=1 Tax=Microtetraspora sp. NBRC 16547 TaxID=3030993 RepID=UPI002554B16E|nr:2-oxo-4-hydroxy-4-carboxy-5-ureidoimidazoline decarboxylase [Microtetraspora sp. NBRC 16547]
MRELSQEELRSCCASTTWMAAVAARQPYADLTALVAAGEAAIAALDWPDVEEALAAHPQIGERAAADQAATDREAAWSRAEQSGTAGAAQTVLDAITRGNAVYEQRFGHVYLVRATGRSAEEMLGLLLARLANDEETERKIVRAELAEIVRLRLETAVTGG